MLRRAAAARANEEVTRSVAEVVRAAQDARLSGEDRIEELEQTVGTSLGRLRAVADKMETLRRALWTEKPALTSG